MAHDADTIHVADNSELAGQLDRIDQRPVRLEKNGVVYRVIREDDPWIGYDPTRVKQALSASRGLFAGTDTEKYLREIGEPREQGPGRHSSIWEEVRPLPCPAAGYRETRPTGT